MAYPNSYKSIGGSIVGTRKSNRLTPVAVNAKKLPGYYADGNGLYLQVSASGSKSWLLRFSLNKRAREMGLGSTADWTLAEAREQARKFRQLLAEGVDPIAQRQTQRATNSQAAMQRRTFEQCAREYYALHEAGWKNVKHAGQWINTLATYVFPIFGSKDVSDVSKADIMRALDPIWATKTETASRVRQRIRAVLDWAAGRDYRVGHDVHIWDQIAVSLPKGNDIKKTRHFASCPYTGVFEALQTITGGTAGAPVKAAIEFLVLTAARSGEVRGARWNEIDFANNRWIVPAERMKAAREQRVPLSPRAIEILEARRAVRRSPTDGMELIFASERNKAYSDMTFTMLLRRLGFDFTIHGFRSTFRDWSAEQTAFPREVCEAALAHVTKDATEAAYFRSDLFEKRRQLMDAWATYCAIEKPVAQVVSIGTARTHL